MITYFIRKMEEHTLKRRIKLSLAFLLVVVIAFFKQSLVEAEELNFTVEPIFPANQISKSKPYFDLRVEPGQKQTIEVRLANKAEKEISVYMQTTAARTNSNGVIEYKNFTKNYDESLKFPFSEIAKVQETVVLKGKEEKLVPIEIQVPEEPFTGMILGGLYFRQESYEEDKNEKNEGAMEIKNTFSYMISVRLTENDDVIDPDLKLLSAKASQANAHNVIAAILQNPEPVDLNDLKINGKVYRKGESTALYSEERGGMRMAPNSSFSYQIPLNGKAFVPGKYEVEVTATSDKQNWKFRKEFEITKEEADKLNDESVEELDYGINWWLWGSIAVAVLVIIAGIVFFLVRRKINKVKQDANKGKKKSKKSKSKGKKSK